MVALEAVAVILAAATDVASSSAVIIAAAAEVAHTLKVTAGKAFPTADVVVLPADDVAAVMAPATKVTAAHVAAVVPVISASAVA